MPSIANLLPAFLQVFEAKNQMHGTPRPSLRYDGTPPRHPFIREDFSMTDQRIEGAANTVGGRIKDGIGGLTGNDRLQAEGKLDQVKGKALDAYGRVIDGLDGLVEKAPVQYQDKARQGLDFARRKPLLTTGIVAGLAVLLGGLGRRR
jgi:uncharacterized protein YjbJ (UPF0337 family)